MLSAGHGEQILLSLSTEELLGGSLNGTTTLRDLGEHTLKDLGRPERIFQAVVEDLRDDFPLCSQSTSIPTTCPFSRRRSSAVRSNSTMW